MICVVCGKIFERKDNRSLTCSKVCWKVKSNKLKRDKKYFSSGFKEVHYKPRTHSKPYSLWGKEGKTLQYQRVVFNGKMMSEQRAVWIINNGEIPKGYEIHHINKDTMDNRIENLQCLSKEDHFNLHKKIGGVGCFEHKAWNKGRNNPKEMVENARLARIKHYLPLFIRTYIMYKNGVNVVTIAKHLNITNTGVYGRLKSFRKYIADVKLL